MSAYRRWLRQQLAALDDSHPNPDHEHYDGIADVIAEARRRAADAGLPDAVQACRVRRGGLTATAAREILAACLAACTKTAAKRDALNVQQAADVLGVSERVLRSLVASGELGHHRVGNGRGQIRILPRDIEDYQRRAEATGFKHLFR